MRKTIDYFFSPASGFTYLGHQALMALAAEVGAMVRFHPVDIRRVYAEMGTTHPLEQCEARQSYRIEDQRRWARLRGLRMTPNPAHHPVDVRLPCRVILATGRLGLDQDAVTLACLRGVWAEGRNISDPGDLGEALRQIDLPAYDILHEAEAEDVRDEADAVTQSAIEAEIFGSPTYVVDGERFWGQDRIEFMREKLLKAAA